MIDKTTEIPILFFSGSGSTKMVAEVLGQSLALKGYSTQLIDLLPDTPTNVLDKYDFFVIGTPTYNEMPARVVLDFIGKLSKNAVTGKRVYVYATYGLYPINCQRIVAKRLQEKGAVPVGYAGLRGPASDGVLMFPSWLTFLFKYERNASRKLHTMSEDISVLAANSEAKVKIPRIKWYTPFDIIPNKVVTSWIFKHLYRPNFRVIAERWDGDPINTSYPDAWDYSKNPPRYVDADGRDFSLRCVHRTPNKAVIYADKMKDKPRLTPEFYTQLKQQLINEIDATYPMNK